MTLLTNTEGIAWVKALTAVQVRDRARAERTAARFAADIDEKCRIWDAHWSALCLSMLDAALPEVAAAVAPDLPPEPTEPDDEAGRVATKLVPFVLKGRPDHLVEHPVETEEIAARATSPALDGFPGGSQQQPGEAPNADRPPVPAPVVSVPAKRSRVATPVALRDVIRQGLGVEPLTPSERLLAAQAAAQRVPAVAVEDLWTSIEHGLAHPGERDAQRLPAPFRFQRGPHDQIFVITPGLEHQVGGKLLAAYALNEGDAPKCITNRREVRDYLIRVEGLREGAAEGLAA